MSIPQQPTALSVSVREAAALTSLSEYEIRSAVNAQELPASRRGTRIIILTDDLRTWLHALPKVGDVA